MAFEGDSGANSLEKPSDLGKTPEAEARRWKLEIKLADKRESAWRKKAGEIYKKYTPEVPETNSYNILWPNTETLRQAVYNSLPQPDARRRYQDADPLGKAVGEVLTRALEFSQDTYDFDAVLKGDVLDMLLPGRAVSRVRYVPDIRTIGSEETEDAEKDAGTDEETQENESYEEIEWEQVICERVQFDDFRILCAAKTWDEVTAIGFRHRFTRDDCIEKFGEEIGKAIPLDAVEDEDVKRSNVADLFKTAEVWEIWCKEDKEVIWICPTYDRPCKVQDDPMQLQGFFPTPRPLYAIENAKTLVPAALYTQYEQQAKELAKISTRINKLTDALKVRGVYDATLTELSELMKGQDNDLIPAQNVTALLERGGLDKAIWMMPIADAANVLKILNEQREACKAVIYELTGISDIMRAATDPKETFGAQKIKTAWGTQRLQRMQLEVQRYIRDLIRLKAEIIAEKFQMETLEAMTGVKLPHQAEIEAQKAQAMAQYQQSAMQAQQAGQQPPPPPQMPPDPITWEAVIEAMRSDATRTYRIDIETDSTLAATQDGDMSALKDLLGGIASFIQGVGPAVQAGALPVDAVKQIIGVIVRRAKMGTAVEDALEKMQEPKPPADPNAGQAEIEKAKLAATAQLEQMKMQGEAQLEQFKAQMADQQHQRELAANAQAEDAKAQREMALEQHKQQVQAQQIQHQNELEAQREMQRQALEAQAAQAESERTARLEEVRLNYELEKTDRDNATRVVVAQIAAQAGLDKQLMAAQQASSAKVAEVEGGAKAIDKFAQMHTEAMNKIGEVVETLKKPKTVLRDEQGRVAGVQ